MVDKPKAGNPNIKEASKSTQWVKGQSGNPAGRPPLGSALSDILRDKLELRDKHGKVNKEVIVDQFIEALKDPTMRAYAPLFKELLDRIEGKVPDTHKLESDVPITIIFKPTERDATQ